MRTARLIAVLSALVLTLLTASITAGAAEPDLARASLPCKDEAGQHLVCAAGKEIGDTNKFVTYGKVPTYKGRTIKIQRRACGTCTWKFFKETRTSEETGWFRTRIEPGKRHSKVCYRVVVPSTKKYRTTRIKVGCIITT